MRTTHRQECCPSLSTSLTIDCAPMRRVVVTKSYYTQNEDFRIADAVFDCIGDAGDERFSLSDLTTPGMERLATAARA